MVLDLNNMTPEEIDATVIHQFGHSLGLGHALMKRDHWDDLKEYVDANKIMSRLRLTREEDFDIHWTGVGAQDPHYDDNSVMLFR